MRPRLLRAAAADQSAAARRPAARRAVLLLARRVAEPGAGVRRARRRAVAARRAPPVRPRCSASPPGRSSRWRGGGRHRLAGLPARAGAPAELRHPALQRPARGARAGRGVPARRRAGPVRVDRGDLGAQHVRAGVGEQGFPGVAVLALLGATLAIGGANALAARDTYGIGSAALLGAWCGLLANSAFVDTLHWRHLWIVAGLIWAGAMRGGRGASLGPSGKCASIPVERADGRRSRRCRRRSARRRAPAASRPATTSPSSVASLGESRSRRQTTITASAQRATSWPSTGPSSGGPSTTT